MWPGAQQEKVHTSAWDLLDDDDYSASGFRFHAGSRVPASQPAAAPRAPPVQLDNDDDSDDSDDQRDAPPRWTRMEERRSGDVDMGDYETPPARPNANDHEARLKSILTQGEVEVSLPVVDRSQATPDRRKKPPRVSKTELDKMIAQTRASHIRATEEAKKSGTLPPNPYAAYKPDEDLSHILVDKPDMRPPDEIMPELETSGVASHLVSVFHDGRWTEPLPVLDGGFVDLPTTDGGRNLVSLQELQDYEERMGTKVLAFINT